MAMVESTEFGYAIKGALTVDNVSQAFKMSLRFPSDTQLDLGEVSTMDSAGLSLLVYWKQQAGSQGGDVQFINPPEQVASIAKVAGLEPLLTGVSAKR